MLTVERVAALHKVPIFTEVPGRVLATVAQLSTETHVEAGVTFLNEGDVEDHLWVILAGRVRIHLGDRTLRELGAGETVGELAALVPEARSASAVALEPTDMLRIDKPVLDELLADHPALSAGIIAALVARLRHSAPLGPATAT